MNYQLAAVVIALEDVVVNQLVGLTKRGRRPRGEDDPFARFSDRARNVISLAQDEARALGHDYLGTEHLLLGLLRESDGAAAEALDSVGVTLAGARTEVLTRVGRGPGKSAGELKLTGRAKETLGVARETAKRLRRWPVERKHLLFAVASEGEGIAHIVLTALGVDAVAVAAAMEQALLASAAESPATRGNVVMCRLDDASLEAIDVLIEAGVHATRSDAAARLIRSGIGADAALFAGVTDTVAEIRRLRAVARAIAAEATAAHVARGDDARHAAGVATDVETV